MYPFISFHFFFPHFYLKRSNNKKYIDMASLLTTLQELSCWKVDYIKEILWDDFFPSIHSLLTLTATVYCFNLGRALADILICDRHSIDFFFYIIRRYTRTLVRDKFLKIFIILFPLSFIIFFWFIMKNEGFKWSGLYFFFPSYHFRFIYEKSKGKIIIQIKSL